MKAARPFRCESIEPRNVGISSKKLGAAWGLVRAACEKGAFAGAVGLVAREGRIVLHEACGFSSLFPKRAQMRKNSIFDLASVTKAVVTTTCIMALIEKGKLSLNVKVSSLIPEFEDDEMGWKGSITVEHLLTHTSGLPAWSDFYVRHNDKASIFREICSEINPTSQPGSAFVYSDLGFILLGRIVEVVSQTSLDAFAKVKIFDPLGLRNTGYRPSAPGNRIVATEFSNWRHRFVQGEAHDENAYAMSGISGHAGLFSTAEDLALFCQSLLGGKNYNGPRILSDGTIRVMSANQTEALGGYVGLGWWVKAPSTPNVGRNFSSHAFGHNGYTGTSVWVEPLYDLSIILLTNRIHPVREGDPNADKSVGIMMSRKKTWKSTNQEFQDAVLNSVRN